MGLLAYGIIGLWDYRFMGLLDYRGGKRSISKDLAIKISNRYKISLDDIVKGGL